VLPCLIAFKVVALFVFSLPIPFGHEPPRPQPGYGAARLDTPLWIARKLIDLNILQSFKSFNPLIYKAFAL
jgi:hypothetical protein